MSGARIEISPEGVYVPGTTKGIVTITGSPKSVAMAKDMIEEQVAGSGNEGKGNRRR